MEKVNILYSVIYVKTRV